MHCVKGSVDVVIVLINTLLLVHAIAREGAMRMHDASRLQINTLYISIDRIINIIEFRVRYLLFN